jgi:hypothetical protein
MWLSFPRLVGALSPLPILIACASGGATSDPSVITAPELSSSRATNTYDAIRHIRPEFLRSRESGSLLLFTVRRPVVAVNDSVVGGVEALRAMPLDDVARIEYLSAWKAANRYGSGLGNDGIVLVTKR